jgi:crotonyl-CoA carboxylase/reductase
MIDLCDIGERPPLGEVPKRMHAYLVRQNRFGQPKDAWRREIIPTPTLGPDEVLIYVMASGINYNNVWAALGTPLDVIAERQRAGEPEDFHAGGSDCSGIVWALGKDVKSVKVGDEVVVHSGWWRPDDPWVRSGKDPMLAESTRIWGYQTNYGSFCQFARCQAHQCVPKPPRPRIACSWAGRHTSSSPVTSSSCGAPPAGSAAWDSRSRAPSAAARSRSSPTKPSASSVRSTARLR